MVERCYAILRIDEFQAPTKPEHMITVKKIVWEPEIAQQEVDRLNGLCRGRPIRYYWQTTRAARRSDT